MTTSVSDSTEFWVTVATVLPVLGLPLIFTARAQIGFAMKRSEGRARFMAAYYAAALFAVYFFESVAIYQLADRVEAPGAEGLKEGAAFAVTFACAALVANPAFALFRLAIAGPGLSISDWVKTRGLLLTTAYYKVHTFLLRRRVGRLLDDREKALVEIADAIYSRWLEGERGGVFATNVILSPSQHAIRHKLIAFKMRTVSEFRELEEDRWRKHYDDEHLRGKANAYRQEFRETVRRMRSDNLMRIWEVTRDSDLAGQGG